MKSESEDHSVDHPKTCPRCGSTDVAPILYGLPAQDAFEAAQRGEVVLGGCEPQDAALACRACGAQWSDDEPGTAPPSGTKEAELIARVFNSYFCKFHIEITPQDVRAGYRASIADRGWGIHYVVDADDAGQLYLEFYATHRMTNDRHVRISSTGQLEQLDAINGMVFYDPNVGGDKERASRENIERNRRVAADLEAKGLYPSGDINTFLRMGGMEASDSLDEMQKLVTEAGLAMPPIPNHLRDSLFRVKKWCYATKAVDPLEMYRFESYLIEAVTDNPDPYFAFSHAGHGINSYAINYQVVIGRIALFVQIPWGGGYMDKERQAAAVAQVFSRCADLLGVIPDEVEGDRLLVAVSELRQLRLCGWIGEALDEEGARRWLATDELTVPDPFEQAKLLLTQARGTSS